MNASPQALAAVRAAKNCVKWGPDATVRYLIKRGAYRIGLVALRFELRRAT